MTDDDTPRDQPFEDDPEVSGGEAPQAMGMFTEQTEPDVRLDPDNPAFDRVQDGKAVDDEYEREYNRRYVKEHGDRRRREAGDAEPPDAEPGT